MFVRELEDGQTVDQTLMVREREPRRKRDGSAYLRMVLADRTGTLPAVLWDVTPAAADAAEPGRAVRVAGTYVVHSRYGPQLTIEALEAADLLAVVDDDRLHLGAADVDAPAQPGHRRQATDFVRAPVYRARPCS